MDCNLEVVCVCVCLFGPHPVLGARYCVLCVWVPTVWLCCEYDVIHTLSQKGKKVIIKVIKIEHRII